jgi:hypothetical protein
LSSAEIDIGRAKLLQALVVAVVDVVLDQGFDLRHELAKQIIVLQQDAALQHLASALDLALGQRRAGRSTDMQGMLLAEPSGQVGGGATWHVAGEQPRLVQDAGVVAA